jgi:hypothetical protein
MAFGIFGNAFRFPDRVARDGEREHFLGNLQLRRGFFEVRLSGEGCLHLGAGTTAAATRRLCLDPLLQEHACADHKDSKYEKSRYDGGTLHKKSSSCSSTVSQKPLA